MKTLARRLARLEAAKAPPARPYSPLVETGVFDTREEAVARHRAAYGKPPRGQGLFIVPAHPANADEEAECLRRAVDQQLQLVGTAKRARVAIAPGSEPASSFPVGIRPALPFAAFPKQWVMN